MFKIFFDINDINTLFCYNILKKMLPFSGLTSSILSSIQFSSSSLNLKMQLFIYCFCSLCSIQIVRMNESKPSDNSFTVVVRVLSDLTNEENMS